MKRTILILSGLVFLAAVCLEVWAATSAVSKTTYVGTNAVAITFANDKTELVTIWNQSTNLITVSAMSNVSGTNGVVALASGGSTTFSKGANAVAGMKLYAIAANEKVFVSNIVYTEQWIQ